MPTNSKEYMRDNYKKFWWTTKAIKDRAMRNSARRLMIKEWKVSKWDWKEVDHKNWISKWNWKWNLRVISRLTNRILGQKKAMKDRAKKYNTK
jgi:hypothetical protein